MTGINWLPAWAAPDGTETTNEVAPQRWDLVPLAAGSQWQVMSPVAVRTTGLPARLLSELSGPAGVQGAGLEAELDRTTLTLARIAALDPFREAVAWQNPGALKMFDSLARMAGDRARDSTRRKREYRLQRYVARYCGKTETIGFFGPLGWGTIAPEAGHVRQRPGATMIRRRQTFAEPWSVRALVSAMAADDAVRAWLPVRLRTHYSLQGNQLRRPRQAPQPLTACERAVLVLCDGVRPRCEIVATAAAQLGIDLVEAEQCLTAMVRKRYLVEDANLPLGPECLAVLEKRLAAIEDGQAAAAAHAVVAPHLEALRALADAHGSADAVAAAQQRLAAIFEGTTGAQSARRGGLMYAGRGIAYEDCLRDLKVELGERFLERVSEGLSPVLAVCQWLTWQTRAAYEEHFRRAWDDGRQDRCLDTVWFDMMRAFFGTKPKPMDGVLTEFRRRWRQLVDGLHQKIGGWNFTAHEFRCAVDELFPSPGPGWPGAAVHSPDLQLAAHSPDGIASGDYTVVLGEIHIASTTISGPVFEWPLDDYQITKFLRTRLGPDCLPVFPETWPRNTGRTTPVLTVPGDIRYAFADTEGAPDDTISIADIRVGATGGSVCATLPDGTRVEFGHFFGFFLSAVVIDAWKQVIDERYTPRMSVGGVIVTRETWRVDVCGEPFAHLTNEPAAYRAVHEWRCALGMPDRVYVKLAGEVKPFYVDFSAPISVLSFLAVLRTSIRASGDRAIVTVTEAVPSPEQAWVVDADGERYLGEIRMVIVQQSR